jgi:hypothetical protein
LGFYFFKFEANPVKGDVLVWRATIRLWMWTGPGVDVGVVLGEDLGMLASEDHRVLFNFVFIKLNKDE